MTYTLLKTKLYRPPTRPEFVYRPQLLQRLDEGFQGKLTVVSAPAGYGKTTLVSEWANGGKGPVAWVSLDKDDNDPARFLTYVIASIQVIQPDLGQDILPGLQSAQSPAILNFLPILLNQLDDIQVRFALVLDDYQVISSPEIHKAIIYIIEHQPQQLHLILTTRIDPPLPLSRLRSRGQLTELRQSDLSFSTEETLRFLKQNSGIDLTSGDVNILVNRTEGWIASLQMAALSMRHKDDIPGFLQRFGGSHEYIVDYFASEILADLPEQTRSFLLKTSFLNQLCGSLCDYVAGQTGSQQLLERLQDENLFIFPLDDEHTWYRYHQLFADYLYICLVQDIYLSVPELHLRASQWFEQHDFPHQAVEHAFLASDYDRAAQLIEVIAEPVLGRGEYLWLLKQIEGLPEKQSETHVRLNIIRALIFIAAGTLQQAEEMLQTIKTQMATHADSQPTQIYMNSRLPALQAMIAIQRGDAENAKKYATSALEILQVGNRNDSTWRANSLLALGSANITLGNLVEARQNLAAAIETADFSKNPYTFLELISILVEVLWSQGNLNEAVERCQEGLVFISQYKLGWMPVSGEVLIRWCLLSCERGNMAAAEEFLERGMELIRLGGVSSVLAWAFHIKMFYLITCGDLLGAVTIAEEAEHLPQIKELPARVISGISALKTLSLIRLGRLNEAEDQLRKRGTWIGGKIRSPYQREYQSLAALLIAKGDTENTAILLGSMIEWADTTKQYRTLICSYVLQALVYREHKDVLKATHSLGKALDLAEPEGYCQAILEVGDSVIPLLYEAVKRGIHPSFATRLIDFYNATLPGELLKSDTYKQKTEVLIPLKTREIEVLKLVAEGYTNKEVAQKLHITLRTVKFHMTNIMTKLEVDNRMQAVTRGKMLGIF